MKNEKEIPRSEEDKSVSDNRDLLNGYLKDINEVELKAAEAFDKQILGLSSGGLGLSINFLTKFAVSQGSLLCLKISWIFFIAAILFTVFSYFFRAMALDWQVEKVEKYFLTDSSEYPNPKNNPYVKILKWFGGLIGIFFVIGVILTAVSMGTSNGQEIDKKVIPEVKEKINSTLNQKGLVNDGK